VRRGGRGRGRKERKGGKSCEWFALRCMRLRVGGTFHRNRYPCKHSTARYRTRFLADAVRTDRDPAAYKRRGLNIIDPSSETSTRANAAIAQDTDNRLGCRSAVHVFRLGFGPPAGRWQIQGNH